MLATDKHLIPFTGADRYNDNFVISGKPKGGTYQFRPDCAAFSGSTRMFFAGSCLPVYMKSSKKIFGKNTNHIRHIHHAGKRDRDNNNEMERLNGEVCDREKVFRGLKKFDIPRIDGLKTYYNFTKKHLALQDRTPAQASVIKVDGKNRWKTIILKIHDLDNLLDPDKEDKREAFSEIQDRLCELRKKSKCTILLEGGKLTVPSLVRGFDIVVNSFSGRNKKGFGKPRKNATDPIGYSQYFIKEKMIFYPFKKMIEYAKNQLKETEGSHGLRCKLSCCIDVKSIEDINRDIWNYSVTRRHYALTMNEIVKEISKLINKNEIHKAKDMILLSELCVLKHLIPDV